MFRALSLAVLSMGVAAAQTATVPTQAEQDRATINYLQGQILSLQQQLSASQQSVLQARVCSDAKLVWADCIVDTSTWTAKAKTPPAPVKPPDASKEQK